MQLEFKEYSVTLILFFCFLPTLLVFFILVVARGSSCIYWSRYLIFCLWLKKKVFLDSRPAASVLLLNCYSRLRFDIIHYLQTGRWTDSVRRMIFEMILSFNITLCLFILPLHYLPLTSHNSFSFTFSFTYSFSFTAACLSVQGRPGLRMLA